MSNSKVKEFIEGLRKDKKKGLIFFLFVLGLPIVIILGVISSNNDEPKIAADSVSSIEVPVNDKSVEEQFDESEFNVDNSSSFFGANEVDSSLIPKSESEIEEEKKKREDKGSFKNYDPYSGSKTYKKKSSGNKKNNNKEAVDDVEVEKSNVIEESRRRRAPSDELGNMGSNNNNNVTSLFRGVVANEDRVVRSGSYVKIRLIEDIKVDGKVVKKNSTLTGIAKYGSERMMIEIVSVRIGNIAKKVSWVVYDEDGNLGVAVPASVLNSITKDGVNEVASGVEVNPDVPVVGSVKVNLKKRNSEVSFILRDGHKLYVKIK